MDKTNMNLPKNNTYIIGKTDNGDFWIEQFNEGEPIGLMTSWCQITGDQYSYFTQVLEIFNDDFQDETCLFNIPMFKFQKVYPEETTTLPKHPVTFSVSEYDSDILSKGVYLHFGESAIIHVAKNMDELKAFAKTVQSILSEVEDNYSLD